MRSFLLAAVLFAATICSLPARAQVLVSGRADAVRIEAHDAALEDVLSALNQNLGLKYRAAVPLQKRVTGTYEGPVRQVLPRLLAGYDFIVKGGSDMIEVVIVGGAKAGDSHAVPARRRRAD